MAVADAYDIKSLRLDLKPRQSQLDLLEFAKDAVLGNKKWIVIDAPVGSGKSFFSVMFMDWYKKKYDMSAQFDILTNSKILQEQYTKDFDFMNSLWGKNSYRCDTYDTDCGTGMEFCKIQNKKCDSCPYATAKYKFEKGDVALSNFHLFLTYRIYMPMAWKRSARVLVIDEAHDFDNVFCDFITTKISRPILKRNGFTDQEADRALDMFGHDPENMELSNFVQILNEDFLPIAKSVLNRLIKEAEETKNMTTINTINGLNNHMYKWMALKNEYDNLPDNWILESEYQYIKDKKTGKVKDKYIEFTAQPVWAYPYLAEKVWDYYDHIICMSGTILDKTMFCKMNGLIDDLTAYKQLKSTFPVENRPIYYFKNIGKQTYATKEIVFAKQKPVIEKILKKYKNEKGIIHTANYELQKWVNEQLDFPERFLAHDSNNRSEILQQHYNTEKPTVLISPSMMVGVDLKDDFSRHQTILKVPYPNLKSKKIKKRMDTMKGFYEYRTAQDIQQSYGRSIRSEDDKADTYILDGCFSNLLKYSSRYFLKWVLDAIIEIE